MKRIHPWSECTHAAAISAKISPEMDSIVVHSVSPSYLPVNLEENLEQQLLLK
jgi:hypothetical protein